MKKSSDYKLLVIGGSAGGLSMVLKIIPHLKRSMNLAVIIVFHRKQSDDNVLVDVLSKRTTFVVREAEDKDALEPGIIFVAPPDYHLLIEKDGTLTLDDSEKINYSRPSIDVTFESAGEAFEKSLICMLLSGANADGVAGLKIAKRSGAIIAVQDPDSAEVPFMPKSALENLTADFIINEQSIAEFLSSCGLQ
jgi:two-component system, chemotaxis family, protein-glutamate methylesterase/glutaminase